MERLVSLINNVSDNKTLFLIKGMIEAKMQEIKETEINNLIVEGKSIVEKHGLPNDYFFNIFQSSRKHNDRKPIKLNQLELLAHVNRANERAQEVRDKKNKKN